MKYVFDGTEYEVAKLIAECNELARQSKLVNLNVTASKLLAISALLARHEREHEALTKIAYEPFGPADASHAFVLDAVTECARAALRGEEAPRE